MWLRYDSYLKLKINVLQLMYEFKELLEENIHSTMSSNWQTVCTKIQADISSQPDFLAERRILDIITKNIYHKKPSKLPFTFVEVILIHNMVCLSGIDSIDTIHLYWDCHFFYFPQVI